MSRIFIRVFTHRKSVQDSHSFLVGTEQGGLSTRLGSLLLEDGENPSLADLRLRIQEGREGGMIKRTVMFEEALCTMRFAANPYNWPEDQRFKYRLGILEENEEVPVLLSEEDERRPLYEVMNPVLHDVVIVPVTQTDRDGLLHVASSSSSSSSKDHTPDS